MSDERKTLIEEANSLGLEFQPNIPTAKLKNLIAEAKGEPPEVEETAPASPKAKVDASEETEKEDAPTPEGSLVAEKPAMTKYELKRKKIADAKARAQKTRVVTITNKDNRENDFMTTVYLSFENQYFGISKIVPLDVPVELENSLIQIAAATMMTLHKDEIIDGKRTGNKVPVRVKKFAISYGKTL